ncbi:MAG: beta-N-acetylhexosaminidase [Eubacteriales bacterium]|jgi:hexosaminidase|nr:beta-N-acetylhexosaminidase [Eubacteriales bacterium]
MPIPQVRKQQVYENTTALCRTAAVFDPALETACEGVLCVLALGEENPSEVGAQITFRQDSTFAPEQYAIYADANGVLVAAGTLAGAVYAAATIAQLCAEHGGTMPFCLIEDAPEHAWRGLLIDVCRHFFPMTTVKTLIDLMAYYKYNRLHLHLTEDQGFRFESERFPRLNSVGSYRKSTYVKHGGVTGQDGVLHGGFYSKAELRELVRYAKARGIEIVPEIDMPGHALSILAAYPQLACFEESVEVATRFGVTDFSNKLYCAGKEKTYEFLFSLLDEVLEVFPFEYVHIGGDEALKSEWKRCKKCQAVKLAQGLKDEHELQGYFLNRVIAYLESRGREAIVWNDGLCDTLSKRAICQYWTPLTRKGPAQIAHYVNAGGKAILSPVTRVYYDYPYAATPLVKTYGFSPIWRGIRKNSAGNILGVEAAIWTEWIDTEDKLFFNTLPRLAATAETGWSARAHMRYDAFLQRLKPHYALYDRLGLTYAKHVEQPLPPTRRIRGTVKFVMSETHAELHEQMKRAEPEEPQRRKKR